MKKQDLVEGTIYAYRKDSYSGSRPVRLVSTTLLKLKTDYTSKKQELFKAPQGAVPGHDYSKNVGYLVLAGADAEQLAAFDIEAHWKRCVEAKEMIQPEEEGLSLQILNNRYFTDLWETVSAARDAKFARIRQNNAEGMAWQAERMDRFVAARDALAEALGEVPSRSAHPEFHPIPLSERADSEIGRRPSSGTVTLTLEQMEKLAALLSGK